MNQIPVHDQLDPSQPWVRQARSYGRIAFLFDAAVGVLGLLFLAGAAWAAPWVVSRLAGILPGRWLVLLAFAGLLGAARLAVTAPLGWAADHWLERQFGLSTESLPGWLWRQAKSVLVSGAISLVLLAGFYGALWHAGWSWWLWVYVGAVAGSVLMSFVLPVWIIPIFFPSRPIEDAELTRRLEGLAEGTGLRISGIYRLGLSRSTRKANAALVGFGRTRRVLLADTLLETMSREQTEAVFAHELGHHVLGHTRTGLLLGAGGLAVGVAIAAAVFEPVRSANWTAAVQRLPAAALAMSLASLLAEPLVNWLVRRWERQADRFALDRVGSADSFVAAMIALARRNLADPNPPRWREVIFSSHPSIAQRVMAAERWAEGRRRDARQTGQ